MPMILFSLLLALVLEAVAVPEVLRAWWPEWLLMCTLYWVVHVTPRFGMGWAWGVGIALDVLSQTPFGVNGLAFLAVAGLAWRNAVPLRMLGHVQWLLVITGLLGVAIAVRQVALVIGGTPVAIADWATLLPSVCLWPLLAGMLGRLRHTFELDH